MSGGTQQATDVDVAVSVADDGQSVAIRVVLKGESGGKPRLPCAPLWLFVATLPSSEGHSEGQPGDSWGSSHGAWVMIPVDDSDWLKAVTRDEAYSPSMAAQSLEALPVGAMARRGGLSWQWSKGCADHDNASALHWMLSRWIVACPPAPSESEVRHSEVLGVLGLEAKTADSPGMSIRESGSQGSACGGEGAIAEISVGSARGALRRSLSVMVSRAFVSADGASAVDGAVLEGGLREEVALTLRVHLPLQLLRAFEDICRRWSCCPSGTALSDGSAGGAEGHDREMPTWRKTLTQMECLKPAASEDKSLPLRGDGSNRDQVNSAPRPPTTHHTC